MSRLKRRFERKPQKKLTQLESWIFSALAAVGIAVAPVTMVDAGEIYRSSDTNKTDNLLRTGKADIYAEGASRGIGVNSFSTFKVSQDNVANMRFATESNKKESFNTLVNIVSSRIDINGTVNAIREGNIDGHMYFLSKNGMFVGSSGVINAGQLTVIAPNKDFEVDPRNAYSMKNFLGDDTTLGNFDKVLANTVALNENGTIVVNGSINTAGGVDLRAVSVQVGDSQLNTTNTGNSGQIVTNGAIRTGVDFKNLVNTNNLNVDNLNGSAVNAALVADKETGDYKLTFVKVTQGDKQVEVLKNSAGDTLSGDASVKITAENTYKNYRDNDLAEFYKIVNFGGNNTIRADISLAKNSEISALGDVAISATASNDPKSFLDYWGFNLEEWNAANVFNSGVYAVRADINVDGNIEGRTVDIAADSHASFDNAANKGRSLVTTLYDTILKHKIKDNVEKLQGAVDFFDAVGVHAALVHTQAEVKIGADSSIIANGDDDFVRDADKNIVADDDTGFNSGGALRITAFSSAEANVEREVQNCAYDDDGKQVTDASDIVNLVGLYSGANSEAKVTIEGSLETEGAAVVAATSKTDGASSAVIARPQNIKPVPGTFSSSGNVNLAAAITVVDDKATVEFKNNSSLTAGGAVQLASSAEDAISVKAKVATDENALINIGAGLALLDSNNKVDINGSIVGSEIDVSASETLKKSKININSSVGKDDPGIWKKVADAEKKYNASKFIAYLTSPIKTLITGYSDKEVKTYYDPDNISRFGDVGTTFGLELGNVSSDVILGKFGSLKSTGVKNGNNVEGGDISISSTTLTKDSYFSVQNTVSNKDTRDQTKALVSASVGVMDVDSKANITIAGRDEQAANYGEEVPVNGIHSAGALSLAASSTHDYGRLDAQLKTLENVWKTLKNAGEAFADLGIAFKDLYDYYVNFDDADMDTRVEMAAKEAKAWAELYKLNHIQQVQAVQDMIKGLPSTAKDFFAPSNYAQFYVANATAANLYTDGGVKHQLDAKFAVAGAVGVNDLSNVANIVIGKNSELISEGELSMSADATRKSSAIYGKVMSNGGWILPKFENTSGAENGLGVTIGIDSNDLLSTIAVAENTKISGESLEFKVNNYARDMAFTFGGADAVNNSGSGMVHVMGGNSNAIILADDESKLLSSGELSFAATNTIKAYNIVGDFNSSAAKSIGFGAGVMDYDVHTIAGIADNDVDNEKDKEKKYANRDGEEVEDLLDLLGTNLSEAQFSAANFGSVNTEKEGEVEASELSVDANSSGKQNVFAIAGVGSGSTKDFNGIAPGMQNTQLDRYIEKANTNPGWQITTAGSVAMTIGENETASLLEGTNVTITPQQKGEDTTDLVGSVKLSAKDDIFTAAYSGGVALSKMSSTKINNKEATLSGAVAFNKISKNTISQIKDASINNALEVSNKAENSGAQVAIGLGIGAAMGGRNDRAGFDLAMSGSINLLNNNVHANILDTSITSETESGSNEGTLNAPTVVTNLATDKDLQVSGGLAADYSKSTAALGGNLGLLIAENNVQALIGNTNANTDKVWTNVGAIQNYAASKLNQVNGAISVGYAGGEGSKFSGNAAVALSEIDNTVKAEIANANITAKSLDNRAFDGLVQGDTTENQYVETLKTETEHNYENVHYTQDENGEITDVSFTHSTETKDFIDTDGSKIANTVAKDENGESTLQTLDTSDEKIASLTNGQDPTADNAASVKVLREGLYTTETLTPQNAGNKQVGFALSGALRNSDQAGVVAGAAAVKNTFKNTFDSSISGGSINLTGTEESDALNVEAKSNTSMTGFAAGVAFDNNQSSGAVLEGSGVGQNITNNIKATIENATITSVNSELNVIADNNAELLSIAGQAALTGGTNLGLGLAVAKNEFNNTTGAYIKGSDITGSDNGIDVNVRAANNQNSNAWAIGGTYNQQPSGKNLTAEGTFAFNDGTNNTEAIVDESKDANNRRKSSKIAKASNVSVTTRDESTLKAVAGAISIAKGNVALGGAWAENNLGTAANKQNNTAAIRNTEIIHVAQAEDATDKNKVLVKAEDIANAYAIGIAGSGAKSEGTILAAEGTVAINKQYKNINAEFTNNIHDVTYTSNEGDTWDTVLSAAKNKTFENLKNDNKQTDLEIIATSNEKNVTSADGIGVNIGGNAAVGAGAAYNTSDIDTKAELSNSAVATDNVKVAADNNNQILNIGIGASVVANTSANRNISGDIEFNLADNTIDNDVTARVEGSTIFANENVVVDANGHEKLTNFIGGLGINFSGTQQFAQVAAGAGVGLNTITSDVVAEVIGSEVIALGNGSAYEVKEYNENTAADKEGEIDAGTIKNLNGLIVNAKGDHDLWNLVLNTGIIVSGSGSTIRPNLNVAVAKNNIAGSTNAIVEDTNVNAFYNSAYTGTDTPKDVYVNAYDDTDITNNDIGIAGSLDLGETKVGITAGAAGSTNDVTRNVSAVVTSKAKTSVNAENLKVKALSHSDIYTADAGVAVDITPSGTAQLTNSDVISYINNSYNTTAYVKNINSYNGGMAINADLVEKARAKAIGIDLAVGNFDYHKPSLAFGLGVGVLDFKNGNRTEAGLINSNITHFGDADDVIKANSNVKIEATQVQATAMISIYGAALNALFVDSDVDDFTGVTISGSNIGAEKDKEKNKPENRAAALTVEANNKLKVDATNGSGAGGTLLGVSGMENFTKVDTSTVVNVTDSNLRADTIDVNAKENLNVEALEVAATIGAVNVIANRAHINFGTGVRNEYAPILNSNDPNFTFNNVVFSNNYAVGKINDAQVGLNDKLKQATSKEVTSVAGKTTASAQYTGEAKTFSNGGVGQAVRDLSETSQLGNQGTKVNISNSLLKSAVDTDANNSNAANNRPVNISAERTINANLNVGQGALKILGTDLAFAEITDRRSVGVSLNNDTTINAGQISIESTTNSTLDSTIVQAELEGVAYNHVDSTIEISGENAITLAGATLYSDNSIDVQAMDTSDAENHTVGAGLTIAKAGYLINEIKDISNTSVNITDSTLNISNTKKDLSEVANNSTVTGRGMINVDAKRDNYQNSRITLAEAQGVSGQGAYSIARQGQIDENGTTKDGTSFISLSGDNTIIAGAMNLDAENKSSLRAVSSYAGLDLVNFFGGNYTYGNAYGGASVDVAKGSSIYADYLSLDATVDSQDNKKSIESHAQRVNAAAAVDITLTKAEAITKQTNTINLNTDDIYGREIAKYDDELVNKVATHVYLNAVNYTDMLAKTNGVTAVGAVAFGSNKSVTENSNIVKINIGNEKDKGFAELNSLQANAFNKVTSMDDSYGLVALDGVAVKPYGAYTINNSQSDVEVNVNNDIRTLDYMDIDAHDYNVLDFATVSTKGVSLIDVGGNGRMENTVNNTAKVNVNNAILLSGGDMNIDAGTVVDIGKDNEAYFASTTGVNVLGVNDDSIANDIKQTSEVNITKSILTSNGKVGISAYSDDFIHILGRNDTAFAVFGDGVINLTNTVNTNNSINIDKDSQVRAMNSVESAIIAAWDDIELNIDIAATDSGLIDFVTSDLDNTLTRQNTVDVKGSVLGLNDINIYAGKRDNGSLGNMFVDLTSMASNYSLTSSFNLTNAVLDNNITQTNKVNIEKDASVTAIRDVELYSGRGSEYVSAHVLRYKGIGFNVDDTKVYRTSQDKNDEILIPAHNNEAVIDGNVTAGKANNIKIVIGANADGSNSSQAILLTEDERASITGVQNGISLQRPSDLKIYVNDSSETIKLDEQGFTPSSETNVWTNGDFKLSVTDYGNQLKTRLDELKTLASDYSVDRTSEAYIGYLAEIARIEGLMENMGLLVRGKDAEGNDIVVSGGTASLDVPTITLPDIVAGGGNITVTTDFLHGEGSMEAKGSPEVTITNNTNLMLEVNNIHVQHAGGQINYNNQVITGLNSDETGEGKTKSELIAEINKKAGHEGTVKTVKAQNTSVVGVVDIKGNWNSKFKYEIKDRDTGNIKATGVLDPMANILVNGKLYVEGGNVSITSAADSIVLEGGAIHARDINITAAKGGLYQGYVNGILTTAGNGSVEDSYREKVENIKKAFGDNETKAIEYNDNAPVAPQDNSEYILGENIYISAADINVNSTIQSGFGKYEVNIAYSDDTKNAITTIINNWKSEGSVPLADYEVTSDDTYRIVVGGAVKDTDGSYKMTLNAYFNPYTNKIIVEDVDANGGKIFLSGRVSSTGNGKLIAADGAYNINVINDFQHILVNGEDIELGLQLGNLLVNDSEGLISILDSSKMTKTEIRRNGTITYDVNTNAGETFINKRESAALTEYNPQEDLRYNWSSGETVGTTTYYERVDEESWWGWFGKDTGSTDIKNKISDTLSSWETNADGKTTVEHSGSADDPATKAKQAGTYIGEVAINPSALLGVVYDKNNQSSTQSDVVTEERKHGFLNFYSDYVVKWSTYNVDSKTYTASAKADLPIAIKFAGNADGQSTVAVISQSSVDIAGEIGNKKLYGNETDGLNEKGLVNITSYNGDITGMGGSVYGAEVNLKAHDNIENIKVIAGDKVNLTAIVDNTDNFDGIVDVEVIASAGTKGNVELGSASIAETEANSALAFGGIGANQAILKANGDISNIVNTDAEADEKYTSYIQGQRIDLTSTNGKVGVLVETGDHAVEGNLRSVSLNIEAADDIYAEEKTGIMHVGKINSSNGDVTLKSHGMILDALEYDSVGNDDSVSVLIDKWNNLGIISDANVENSSYMLGQQKVVDEYVASITNLFNEFKDATPEFMETDRYKFLANKFGSAQSVAAYLATDNHYKEIKAENLGINKDLLLYSIQDAIINRDPTNLPSSSSKTPNVRGNNITLIAGNNIGMYDENATRISLGQLNALKNAEKDSEEYKTALDNLRTLSRADASTVEWHLEKDEQGNIKYSDASFAIVNTRLALGLQTNEADGVINIDASSTPGSDVFVEGRIESATLGENNKVVNVDQIRTNAGDIYVSSLGEIRNAHNIDADGKLVSTDAAIIGRDLVLQADGDIGSAEKVMTTDINGALSVVANGKLYLEQIGDDALGIRNVSTSDKLFIQTKHDIYMYNEPGEDEAKIQGYIFSKNGKAITIISQNGSIGSYTEDEVVSSPLRIKNNESFLDENTKAEETVYTLKTQDDETVLESKTIITQDDVVTLGAAANINAEGVSALYPQGVTETNPKGEPYGKLNVRIEDANTSTGEKLQNVSLNVNGYLNLMNDIDVVGSIDLNTALGLDIARNLTANTVNAESGSDVNLLDGTIAAANVNINAGGKVVQDKTATGQTIEATNLKVQAVTGIDLANAQNKLQNVALFNEGKDEQTDYEVVLGNGGSANLNITAIGKSEAAMSDTALDVDAKRLAGKVSIVNYNDIPSDISTDNDVLVTGNIYTTGSLNIENNEASAISISNVNIDSNDEVIIYSDIDRIENKATVKAGSNAIISAGTRVANDGDIEAAGNAYITSRNSYISNIGNMTAGEDAFISAGAFLMNKGELTAQNDVVINAGTGVTNYGHLASISTGSVGIVAEKEIVNTGVLEAQNGSVSIKSETDSVYNWEDADLFAGNGDVTIKADQDIFNEGDLAANGNIVLVSANGDIYNDDKFEEYVDAEGHSSAIATKSITLSAANGKIENTQDLISLENVNITAKEGLTNFAYEIYANENISLTATEGNLINNSQLVSKTGNINLNADKGTVVNLLDGNVFALGGSVNMSAGATADAEHTIRLVDNTDGSIREQTISLPEGVPADAIVLAQYNKETDKTTVFYVNSKNERVALNEAIDGNVDVFRTGDVVNRGDVVALGQTKVNDEGAIETVKPGMVSLKSAHSNVTNYDEFDVVDGENEFILDKLDPSYTGDWFNGKKYILAKSGIGLEAPEGYFYNNMNYVTDGDLTIVAKNDLIIGTDAAIDHVGGNLTVTSTEGKVINDAETVVGGSVTFDGDKGVTNNQNVTAETGDITFKANEGDIENNGAVDAAGDVTMKSENGDVVTSTEGSIVSGGDVTLDAGNDVNASGSIVTEGNVNITADNTVTTSGEEIKANGDVEIVGDKGVTVDSAINSGKEVNVESKEGSVELKQAVEATEGVTVEAGKDVIVSDINSKGDVTLDAGNDVKASGSIATEGNVNITAANTVTTSGEEIKASADVKIAGDKGVTVDSAVNSGKEVNVESKEGSVELKQAVEATEDVTVEAGKDVKVSGSIEAEGNVNITAANTVTTSGEEIKASADVKIAGDKGVTVDSAINSGKEVNVESKEGSVELKQAVEATEGVTVEAGKDVIVSDINSKGDVTLDAGNDVNASGSIEAEGTVKVTADNNATVDNIDSGKEIDIQAQSINTEGNIKANDHISIDATNGDLVIKQNVENMSGGIELYAKDGMIDISKDVTAGSDGFLRISAEQAADKAGSDAIHAAGSLKSEQGSVDIAVENGNASLNNVSAKEVAAVGSKNGDVVLGDISAGTVVLFNKDADNSVAADKVTIGQGILVQSSNAQIGKVEIAPDAGKVDVIMTDVNGKPSGHINLGNADEAKDVQIGTLTVGTANISSSANIDIDNLYLGGDGVSEIVAKEDLNIDSIAVADKLVASGHGYDTSIYGKNPAYDDSNAIYYDDSIGSVNSVKPDINLDEVFFGRDDKQPAIKKVAKEMANLKPVDENGGAKGMSLNIPSANNQTSNGLLLHLDKKYYVHSQRYTAEVLSNILVNNSISNVYELPGDSVVTYARYNLYELPGLEIVNGQLTNTLVEFELSE